MLCNRWRLICAVKHFAFASFVPAGRGAEARLVLLAEKATSLTPEYGFAIQTLLYTVEPYSNKRRCDDDEVYRLSFRYAYGSLWLDRQLHFDVLAKKLCNTWSWSVCEINTHVSIIRCDLLSFSCLWFDIALFAIPALRWAKDAEI